MILKSAVRVLSGTPTLFLEDAPVAAMAYTTYFEERSGYQDFWKAGYNLFFVNASFSTAPINPTTGFTPFDVGIFEDPEHPDYSEFENAVNRILADCPDAVIFPRIYISMPKWWVDSHPEDTICLPGGQKREALYSEAFRIDGGKLLAQAIDHMKAAPYASRIGGWMFCAGQTQEWIYPYFGGDLCPAAQKPYRRWAKANCDIEDAVLPSQEEYVYKDSLLQTSENAKRYARFANDALADCADYFAKIIKEKTDYCQVVGTFFGYVFEAKTALYGNCALHKLLHSPNLDYFSSPNAYTGGRPLGKDWADMMPIDSVKGHGKLPFLECDIRTHLTTGMQRARPGRYPEDIYADSVWAGPPTAELSRQALCKCFCHQITKGAGIWWFDMWGGWYNDPLLMETFRHMKQVYDCDVPARQNSPAQVVFFADPESYENMFADTAPMNAIRESRTAMGNCGAPYDTYLVEDAPEILHNYKAAIFPFAFPSEKGKKALALCEQLGIPCLCAAEPQYALTTVQIRAFLENAGVHLYENTGDVVYAGNGYVGIHAATAGEKALKLPKAMLAMPVFGAETDGEITDTLTFSLEQYETALLALFEKA